MLVFVRVGVWMGFRRRLDGGAEGGGGLSCVFVLGVLRSFDECEFLKVVSEVSFGFISAL